MVVNHNSSIGSHSYPAASSAYVYQINPVVAANPSSASASSSSSASSLQQTLLVHVVAASDEDHLNENDLLSSSSSVIPNGDSTKNSLLSSVFSFVCTTVGAGILSLPNAISESGWIGLVLILLVSLICNRTAQYLIACMFSDPQQPRLRTYEEIGVAALGPKGRTLVAFFQTITLFGVCTIFLILIGGNMNALIPSLTIHVWIFIFGLALIPIAWLKTMKEVAPLAYFGIAASLIVAGIVIVRGAYVALPSHHETSIQYSIIDWNQLSLAFNAIVFSFGGHSVIPNICNEMKGLESNYKRFSFFSYSLIGSVYILVGGFGYAGYGNSVAANVLESIDAGPDVSNAIHQLVNFARIIITVHVFLAYPLPMNPVSLYMEEITGIDQLDGRKEFLSRIVLRTLLVLFTVLIASVVPYFGDFLSLVSALSMIAVAFVFPPWFYYVLYRGKREFGKGELCLMVAIVVFGVLSSVVGVYYSIQALVDHVKGNPFDHFFTN